MTGVREAADPRPRVITPPAKRAPLSAAGLMRQLRKLADPTRAEVLKRFFKTGPGQYGEGDRFLGLTLPALRQLTRQNRSLPRRELTTLLKSPWHEARTLALMIMVAQYRRAGARDREALHRLYLRHTRYVNNWDLVDLSAEHLVGAHLQDGGGGGVPSGVTIRLLIFLLAGMLAACRADSVAGPFGLQVDERVELGSAAAAIKSEALNHPVCPSVPATPSAGWVSAL